MTDVRMRLVEQATTRRLIPAGAVVSWQPTRAVAATGAVAGLLLPKPVAIAVPDAAALTVAGVLPCTGADGWAWRVTVTIDGVVRHQVTVLVPDVGTVVDFETLQVVDPATLDPLLEPQAAWWAAIAPAAQSAAAEAMDTALPLLLPPLVSVVLADDEVVATAAASAAVVAVDVELASRDLIEAPEVVDPGVLVRIEDADGTPTWLEARKSDGGPTARAAEMVAERMVEAGLLEGESVFDPSLLVRITAFDGTPTWLEAEPVRGGPTARAAGFIREAVGDLASSSGPRGGGALNGSWHPRVTKRGEPILMHSDPGQEAVSLYWPWLVHDPASDLWWLFWSTDHVGPTHTDSGIFAASGPAPWGPWTHLGRVFRDDAQGFETETPAVWREPDGTWVLTYQQGATPAPLGSQTTMYATAPAPGGPWTRVGPAAPARNAEEGDGHTGYLKPFTIGATTYALSLHGGTDHARYMLWQRDHAAAGLRFVPTSLVGNQAERLSQWNQSPTPGHHTANSAIWKAFVGDVLWWGGQPWWIGLIGPRGTGGAVTANDICVAPMRLDLRGLATEPVIVTPPLLGWETTVDYFGNVIEHEGQLYGVYRASGKQGGFGLVEVN